MPKGTPITIAGSAYTRQRKQSNPKRRIAKPVSQVKRAKMTGSGDYVYRYKGKTPFADVGRHLGNYLGYGDWGSAIGHGIGRILGSGDYSTGPMIKSNVLVNSTEVPEFGTQGRANVIHHREYLGDLITSPTPGAFRRQTFTINPGLNTTFPWLSTIAQNYEQYKVHGMVFYFKTTSGESVASTNTALGTVIMATDYNVNAAPYASKTEMENSQFAQSFKPSISAMHGIECAPSELPLKNYYVRTGDVAASDSIKWYDLANFQIATQGFQAANVNIGEIWVTYLVEFFKPQIPRSIGGTIGSERIVRSSTTNTAPLGLIGFSVAGNLDVTVTSNSITLRGVSPLQLYRVDVMWICSAAAAFIAPLFTIAGANYREIGPQLNPTTPLASLFAPSSGVATSTELYANYNFQVNDNNITNEVSLTTGGWTGPVGTNNYVTIIITQLDNALLG